MILEINIGVTNYIKTTSYYRQNKENYITQLSTFINYVRYTFQEYWKSVTSYSLFNSVISVYRALFVQITESTRAKDRGYQVSLQSVLSIKTQNLSLSVAEYNNV